MNSSCPIFSIALVGLPKFQFLLDVRQVIDRILQAIKYTSKQHALQCDPIEIDVSIGIVYRQERKISIEHRIHHRHLENEEHQRDQDRCL
jgi:hypothetical protein